MQRTPFPDFANIQFRGKYGFVNRGTKSVLGIENIFGTEIVLFCTSFELVEKLLDVAGKLFGGFWSAPVSEQNQHVETVVKQIDKASGGTFDGAFLWSGTRNS